jgi:hypothetical protein
LLFQTGAATIGVRSKTGGLLVFAGGATITDRFNGTCWGRYVVDGDLDVSGTGTFGEAVTI